MKPTTQAILTHARELIAAGWTVGTTGRDKGGRPVPARDPAACQFCAVGAIYRATFGVTGTRGRGTRDLMNRAIESVCDAARRARGKAGSGISGLASINDHGSQTDILSIFDHAIRDTA